MVHAFLQHAHGHCQIVPITSYTERNIPVDHNQSHSEKQFCFVMYIYFQNAVG